MKKNKFFKVIFKNTHNQEVDCNYRLHESIVAEKWFRKIKHLKSLPIDENESETADFTNLKKIYQDFCSFAGISPIKFKLIDQNLLNKLHEIYEHSHKILSKEKNNTLLYKFHHSIHFHEKNQKHDFKKINVGWGTKEGLLTEHFYCNNYYESKLIKNNIYLPWSELGKKPLNYWQNKEPNNQTRFNELAKPHMTFRAKFFIAVKDVVPPILEKEFVEWFSNYKNNWFKHYNIDKWENIHEYSAPLLAIAEHQQELTKLNFVRIAL